MCVPVCDYPHGSLCRHRCLVREVLSEDWKVNTSHSSYSLTEESVQAQPHVDVHCCCWLSCDLSSELLQTLLFSHSVVADSLRPHGLQHARLPCRSPSPGACSNSCLLTQRCHPTISCSVAPVLLLASVFV